jgi:hypothetical protein
VKLDRKIVRALGLAFVAALALVGKAFAQDPPAGEPPPPSGETARTVEPLPRWRPRSGFGMTLAGGGGVTDFTSSGAREITDVGGAWNMRMVFGSRRIVAFEISYVGGSNTIHSLGYDANHTKLIRNGIEGALRLNAPLYVNDTLLEPYVTGGLGWSGYRVTNIESATSDVSPSGESTLAIPIAAGFLVGYKGFVAELRCTVRLTYGQDTLRTEGSGALTNWDTGAMVGFEF